MAICLGGADVPDNCMGVEISGGDVSDDGMGVEFFRRLLNKNFSVEFNGSWLLDLGVPIEFLTAICH